MIDFEYDIKKPFLQNSYRRRHVPRPLKHQLRLWAAMRWILLIVAIVFAVGYVGILNLTPGISILESAYPRFWGQVGFLVHAIPGSIWLILGALQQFSYIRGKNPMAHKVIGYIGLACLYISLTGGFIICLSGETEGGITLSIDGVVVFTAWGFCGFFGWYYIKFQYNVDRHREWMRRAYLWSYVIVAMRPAVIALIALVPRLTPGEALAIIAPLFFGLAITSIEFYIRNERANQINTETHYLSLPKDPFDAQDQDNENQLVTFRKNFVKVTLVKKLDLTPSTALFIFQLPVKASLMMFPGHHVVLRRRIRGQLVIRPYTPVTSLVRYFGNATHDHEMMQSMNITGTVALAIKKYPSGALSSWLHDSMKIGDTVEMMGPMGGFYYYPNEYESIGLIAGGTGITPVLSVLMTALANSNDKTKFSLLYANSSVGETVFHDELLQLRAKFPDRFYVHMINSRIDPMLLRVHMPPPSDDTQILICGPTGFATSAQNFLRKEKYAEHTIFTFGESDK